jgi:hypothetical protein
MVDGLLTLSRAFLVCQETLNSTRRNVADNSRRETLR